MISVSGEAETVAEATMDLSRGEEDPDHRAARERGASPVAAQDPVEPPLSEQPFYKLEALAFQIGQSLVSNTRSPSLVLASGEASSQSSRQDLVRHICKEIYPLLLGKPIDSLKTNNRGSFMLTDNDCWWIKAFARDAEEKETAGVAVLYLALPCGIVRGALSGVGLATGVTAEIPVFPVVAYTVKEIVHVGEGPIGSAKTGAPVYGSIGAARTSSNASVTSSSRETDESPRFSNSIILDLPS